MRKYLLLCPVLFCLLLVCFACQGQDKTKGGGNSKKTNEQLYTDGWRYYRLKKYSEAEKNFRELSTRSEILGNYGLGWTLIGEKKFYNSQNEFQKFLAANDTLHYYGVNFIAPSDSIFRNIKAGQTISAYALGEFVNAEVLCDGFKNNQTIINNWVFGYQKNITSIDIRLYRAVALIHNQKIGEAIATVKLIDPSFEAEDTVEGRLILMIRIEELMNERKIF